MGAVSSCVKGTGQDTLNGNNGNRRGENGEYQTVASGANGQSHSASTLSKRGGKRSNSPYNTDDDGTRNSIGQEAGCSGVVRQCTQASGFSLLRGKSKWRWGTATADDRLTTYQWYISLLNAAAVAAATEEHRSSCAREEQESNGVRDRIVTHGNFSPTVLEWINNSDFSYSLASSAFMGSDAHVGVATGSGGPYVCPLSTAMQQYIATHPPSKKAEDYTIEKLTPGSVVARLPGSINEQRINIDSCKGSTILLLDECDSVQIDDCESCFFFIGPTMGSVFFRNTRNCVAVVACGQVRCRDVHGLTLSLLCRGMPAIEDSDNIHLCSWSGLFAYPGIEEHCAKAKLSVFTNMYTTVHDFTMPKGKQLTILEEDENEVQHGDEEKYPVEDGIAPQAVGDSLTTFPVRRVNGNGVKADAGGKYTNFTYVSQNSFEEACLKLLNETDSKTGGQQTANGDNKKTADLDDIQVQLPGKHGQQPKFLPVKPTFLDRAPLSAVTTLSGGADSTGENPLRLLLSPFSTETMYRSQVLVPYTHGARAIPQHLLETSRLKLFIASTSNGGNHIARRIARDVEIVRRRSVQIDNDTKTMPSVLLLNSVELCCRGAVLEDHLVPTFTDLGELQMEAKHLFHEAVQRMSGRTCIFLLALLPLDKTGPAGVEAFGMFLPRGAANSNNNSSTRASTVAYDRNTFMLDDGLTDSSAAASREQMQAPVMPSRSNSRYSGPAWTRTEEDEERTAWERSVLLNVSIPLHHLSLLQSNVFFKAALAESGFGAAF